MVGVEVTTEETIRTNTRDNDLANERASERDSVGSRGRLSAGLRETYSNLRGQSCTGIYSKAQD